MTSQAKAGYGGRWRKLVNLSADRKGSIHDDEAAQKMGFRGGFVPGSTVATSAMPAIVNGFGERWMEGGWYTFNFVSPVYVDEEIREVAAWEDGALDIRVVTRDGRLCSSGRAGLGFEAPWDATMDGQRGAPEVLPGIEIGLRFDEDEFTTQASDVRPMLDSAGDETPWYADSSPWGRATLPPERLHAVALGFTRRAADGRQTSFTGGRGPGMWAEHAVALAGPLFLGQTYRMTERVADKGRSGRTIFITYEFQVFDGARKVALGRHKVKWLAAE